MASLKTCAQKHGIPQHDVDSITKEAALLKADGYSGPESIQKAVVSHIKELVEERESIISHIMAEMAPIEQNA